MRRARRARAPCALFAALALAGCDAPPPPPAQVSLARELPFAEGMNLLVVSFDAFRRDRLGLYGHPRGLTPAMDRFAERALVFDQAYTAGQATASSFAAAFSGRLPFRVFRGWRLARTQTIASSFAARGYRTGALLNNMNLTPERGYGLGFEVYRATTDQDDRLPLANLTAFLDAPDPRPFFAWVHFINPHAPYEWRAETSALVRADYDGPYAKSSGVHVQKLDAAKITADDLAYIAELYEGEVRYADGVFARVLAALDERGLAGRTVVALTADHGEALAEHGQIGHAQLHEPVIRIPLVIRHPRHTEALRTDARVVNVDLLPTFLGMFALGAPAGPLDGVDWRAGFDPARPLVHAQMTNRGWLSIALRSGDEKLVVWCGRRRAVKAEWFDLAADPGEREPVHEGRRVEARKRELEQLVGAKPCAAVRDALAGTGQIEGLSGDTVEGLRALGYVE